MPVQPMQSLPPGAEVSLGPFELLRPVGSGGMAQVWLGRHAGTGTEVAIKVVGSEASRQHRWLARFRNEIRAVAGLSHPCIVHVDDFGEISKAAEQGSGGLLRAGSPYLVMEYVPGGSLRERAGRMRWPVLRSVLLRLLDALAHAHAHGLIHRDITPGNVLGDGRIIKLADFGLSHQVEGSLHQKAELGVSGTPAFMAPEQWEGRWRDYGPWTDLYGVGCLAWTMAAGRPPFRAPGDLAALRDMHLWDDLPELNPHLTMPSDYEDWLRVLLHKDPALRFRSAADAVHALLGLSLVEGDEFEEFSEPPEMERTVTEPALGDSLRHPSQLSGQRWAVVLPHRSLPPTPTDSARAEPAPMPSTWRTPDELPPARLLPGAGLRLYGFRPIPVVGRDVEKDALWQALREVHELDEPRAVVLTGPAGCGKSRLARWLCERANEVGAATSMRVTHGPIEGPGDGLGPAMRRFLNLEGLARDAAYTRIRELMRRDGIADPYEWAALTEVVSPRMADRNSQAMGVYFADPGERFLVLRRQLARATEERPVIVWLDDAHWGDEGLRFAQHLLASPEPLGCLVVATVREDVVGQRPLERDLVQQLLQHETASELPLDSLPPQEWRNLVQQILHMEEELAAQVEQRTAGNPLFAVQLVADWIQRDVLEPGPDGFRLRDALAAPLPDDLHQVWQERMRRILVGLPSGDTLAVQLAAVLGQEFDDREWRDLCLRAGVQPTTELMERLLGERLIHLSERGGEVWMGFAHGMLRETNERMAEEAGRLPELHRLCAEMLSERGGILVDERMGRHLLAAEEHGAALAPLLSGATLRREQGEYRHAELLLLDREEALAALGVPETDERWVEGWVQLASLEVERHRLDRAGMMAEKAHIMAERGGMVRLDGWARHILGRVALLGGELERAIEHLHKAVELARSVEDGRLLAACDAARGLANFLQDKLDDAAGFSRRARRAYADAGQALGASSMSLELSAITLRAGRVDEASRHIADALAGFEELGARNSVALCMTQRAAIERELGELDAAELSLRDALAIYEQLGTDGFLVPLVQLAVVLLEKGAHEESLALLERAHTAVERSGGWWTLGALRVLMLPAVALASDWSEFDRLLPEADLLITNTGMMHDDIPRMARQAANIARRSGETLRAARAYRFAMSQWHALGNLEAVSETRAALHGVLSVLPHA